MKRSSIAQVLILGSVVWFAACDSGGGDDIDQPIDATVNLDGPPGDGSGSACVLPSAVITCTVGNNAPCTAVCAAAYCHNFTQVGNVCTSACTIGSTDQCPTGWSCNGMGRCRPPG